MGIYAQCPVVSNYPLNSTYMQPVLYCALNLYNNCLYSSVMTGADVGSSWQAAAEVGRIAEVQVLSLQGPVRPTPHQKM